MMYSHLMIFDFMRIKIHKFGFKYFFIGIHD